MPAFQDLTGQRFARLTVIERAANRGRATQWLCQCECGTKKDVGAFSLRRGDSKSCGCLQAELNTIRATIHGKCPRKGATPEYSTWRCLLQRALNPKNARFKDYGGRGIGVCQRWRENFLNFLDDVGHRPTPNHSLDRIDNDKDYSPENCRWATRSEQQRNTRRSRMLTYEGETRCITEWSTIKGICEMTLHYRISVKGMPIKEAFETPLRARRKAGRI